MLEDPTRSYDPGYAAGATFRRAVAGPTETGCESGLIPRLESWAARHFTGTANDAPGWREACRENFRRGFRDGYWNRARRRAGQCPVDLVA